MSEVTRYWMFESADERHIPYLKVVQASDYDAERLRADTAVADANDAERQLAPLREELSEKQAFAEMFYQKQRLAETKQANAERKLTAAEQRNASLIGVLAGVVGACNMIGTKEALAIAECIDAALAQPTESGASE